MRPYLAIIKDSFREALASRVLWVLAVLITLFLLLLAPLSVRPAAGEPEFSPTDIRNPPQIIAALAEQKDAEQASPVRRIWELLPNDFRQQVADSDPETDAFGLQARLADELNGLLERRDLYREASWRNVSLSEETKELLKEGPEELSEERLARFNRLLIDAAFPGSLTRAPAGSVRISYLGFQSDPIRSDIKQARASIKQVIAILIGWLVGVFGILIAILVTAPIVPKTFETGSVELLLSKPIARPLLFLTKFAGGCAFVTLNATYFLVGLWLIAGLRFGIWSGSLLLCIPVFLFLFVIYYAVSAFSGVLWQSWIMCIAMTAVFWGACTFVGLIRSVVDTWFLSPTQIVSVVPTGENPIVVNRGGEISAWQPKTESWQPILETSAGPVAGPFSMFLTPRRLVYDSQADRLLMLDATALEFGVEASATLSVAERNDGSWKESAGIAVPAGVTRLLAAPDGTILAVGTSGIYRLEGDPTAVFAAEPVEDAEAEEPDEQAGEFVEAGPTVFWAPPVSAAVDPTTSDLAVYERGRGHRLERNEDGQYTETGKVDLKTEEAALIAYAGDTILVADAGGKVRLFSAETLKEQDRFEPFPDRQPRRAVASPDGRWIAVLFHNGRLWLYDAQKKAPIEPGIEGQGDISAVAFTSENRLLVAHAFRRVSEYRLGRFSRQAAFTPPSTSVEIAYRFFINPLYTVFPKPGELDDVVSYLLTDPQQPQQGRFGRQNLETEREVPDIWQPLWSNLAFVTVVLAAACFYVYRKDF